MTLPGIGTRILRAASAHRRAPLRPTRDQQGGEHRQAAGAADPDEGNLLGTAALHRLVDGSRPVPPPPLARPEKPRDCPTGLFLSL